jgi:hypothetical protein
MNAKAKQQGVSSGVQTERLIILFTASMPWNFSRKCCYEIETS